MMTACRPFVMVRMADIQVLIISQTVNKGFEILSSWFGIWHRQVGNDHSAYPWDETVLSRLQRVPVNRSCSQGESSILIKFSKSRIGVSDE